MSLKDAFQAAAVTAFKASGNIPVEVKYQSYVTATSEATTGTVEPEFRNYFVSVVFDAYKSRVVDGSNIQAGDRKAVIPSLNLPVVPSARDRVLVLEGGGWQTYNVVDKSTIPTMALWEIQLRRKG
jgi:hypothetical protein